VLIKQENILRFILLSAGLPKISLARISARKSQTQRHEVRDFVCTSQNIQFLRSNTILLTHFLSYFSLDYVDNRKEYIWIFPPPDEPATRKQHEEYKEVRIPTQSHGCIATGYLPFPQFLSVGIKT
jgi:hypothetical protein